MMNQFSMVTLLCLLLTPPLAAETIEGWGETLDPTGDCPIDLAQNGLTISIPGGRHDLNPQKGDVSAPRVWQEIEGDFLAEVLVHNFETPQPKTGIAGHLAYIASGIVAWDDSGNFMRWARAADGDRKAVYLSCEHYQDGKKIGAGGIPIGEQVFYLRMERRGSKLTMSASIDRKNWREVVTGKVRFAQKLKVGVFSLNVTKQTHDFRLEHFYILGQTPPAG